MAIAKMNLINLMGDADALNDTLTKFIDFPDFHAIEASQFVNRVHGLELHDVNSSCRLLQEEIENIEKIYKLKLPKSKMRELTYSMEEIQNYIQDVYQDLDAELNAVKKTEAKIKQYEEAFQQVTNIEALDMSLDDIFSTRYVAVRFGKLPTNSLDHLKFYKNKPFLIQLFSQEKNNTWCMYIAASEFKREIDNIFSSLFFERIRIPSFVHGVPEEAKKYIEDQLVILREELKQYQQALQLTLKKHENKLTAIKAEINFICKMYDARHYVVGAGNRFSITGFVETKRVEELKNYYSGIKSLEINVRPANSDKRITPPTKLKNRWFARPFQMFVEMYGIPSHRDVDPTLFFAISYTLLFGIMFGDFGQGIVMALLGVALSKWKKMAFGGILLRLGISSAIFGLLYGSFFGNEEFLLPIYTKWLGLADKPIHIMESSFTMNLLIATVAIGAVLILSAIITNIYVRLRNKEYGQAIFSSNGIMGLLFYGFILIGVAINMLYGIAVFTPLSIIFLIIVPVIGIFLKEPILHKMDGQKAFPNGFGGFFVEGFFELFEVFLSYVTNTMSFLRVGGFVLAHAGMMLVVTSLMTMAGNSGSWLIAIFGNLFVMGLEGLIVGIQVLRLEFYEMFSRYYEGGGIEFKSIV